MTHDRLARLLGLAQKTNSPVFVHLPDAREDAVVLPVDAYERLLGQAGTSFGGPQESWSDEANHFFDEDAWDTPFSDDWTSAGHVLEDRYHDAFGPEQSWDDADDDGTALSDVAAKPLQPMNPEPVRAALPDEEEEWEQEDNAGPIFYEEPL